MTNILQSASKVVLILLSITVCVGFIMRVLDAKDFMLLAVMCFTYYFSYTPAPAVPTDPPTDTPPTVLK
jgi:hypothetical protein